MTDVSCCLDGRQVRRDDQGEQQEGESLEARKDPAQAGGNSRRRREGGAFAGRRRRPQKTRSRRTRG